MSQRVGHYIPRLLACVGVHCRVRKVTNGSPVAPLVSSRPFSQGCPAAGHLPFKKSPVVIIQFGDVLLGEEA